MERKGPDKPLEEYIPLVRYCIKQNIKNINRSTFEELVSEGCLALVIALHDWPKAERFSDFRGFAYGCIRNRVINYLRKKHPLTVSKFEIEPYDRDNSYIKDLDNKRKLADILMIHLTKRQQLIFKLRKEGKKLQEIGDMLGCTGSNIGNILKYISRIARKLQEDFEYV